MRNIVLSLTEKILLKKGFSNHYARAYSKNMLEDIFSTDTPLQSKLWALKRGFYSYKIDYFGLNEKNYKTYLPDFDYYRLHPINGVFSHWIDDKLTIRYILQPYKQYLPDYYFHLYEGEIICLPDCPADLSNSVISIINLLDRAKVLAAKLLNSSGGEGFYKLESVGTHYLINGKRHSYNDLITLCDYWRDEIWGGYLITEFLNPCRELSHIWPKSANAVRITTLRNKNEPTKVVDGFIRFGTSKTQFTDSANHGAIISKINIKNGFFTNGVLLNNHRVQESICHPDTGELIEGFIPNWDFIIHKVVDICNYISHIVFMGFDIIVTDDGFKIIEINSHQGIGFNQIDKPYLDDETTKEFFTSQIDKKKQEQHAKKEALLRSKILRLLRKLKHKIYQMIK